MGTVLNISAAAVNDVDAVDAVDTTDTHDNKSNNDTKSKSNNNVIINNDLLYEIEYIFGKRKPLGNKSTSSKKRKQVEYNVKWKNYPLSESTWEPPCNLLGDLAIKELVKFNDEYRMKQNVIKKEQTKVRKEIQQQKEEQEEEQQKQAEFKQQYEDSFTNNN